MSPTAQKSDRRYTYADYLQFPEGERWELIDGVAYDMSPAPAERHQDIVTELATQVRSLLRDKPCRVYTAPFDVRFETSDTTTKVVQPDLLVVCDRNKITERGLIGAPDWIVEILSPHTAGKDQIVKRKLYEAHGVREYWLVHPTDRVVTVYRLGPDGSYGIPDISELKGQLAVTAVPGVAVDWELWQPLDPS